MKKLFVVFLVLAMLIAMVGCGKTEPEVKIPEQTQAPTQAPTEAPTETPTEMPTEAPTELPTEPEPTFVDFADLTTNLQDGSIMMVEEAMDPRDTVYTNVLCIYAECMFIQTKNGYSFDNPYREVYTGGQYKRFTATLIPEKSFDKYGKGYGAYMEIYADEELIYTTQALERKSEGIFVDVDITGAQYIKIVLKNTSDAQTYENIYNTLLVDAKVHYE